MKAAAKVRTTRRRSSSPKLAPLSDAMISAAKDIKDNMTEMQKSQLYLKEGKSLMEISNFAAAIECLNEAISINPHNNSLFLARASCHKSLQMYTEAYYDYSFLIKLEPLNGAHLCSRGLCSAKLKRIALALEDLDTAIEIESTAQHLYSRGTILADSGSFESAIRDFSRALFLQDEQQQNYSELRVKSLYRRASVFYEQRKYNATIKDLLGILIQDPQIVYPRILLGKTLKILGELEKAEEQILFAIFLENDQSSYYAELGDIRYQMGDKNKIRSAITDFDKAVLLLEEQNVRTLKAVTTRIKDQNIVQKMKIAATAHKMLAVDRIATESSIGEMKNDSEKKGKKTPSLRSLSFVAESGKTDNMTTAPLTRELVRQGQITDMLMRSLNKAVISTPNSNSNSTSTSASTPVSDSCKAPVYVTPSFISPLLPSSSQLSEVMKSDGTVVGGSQPNTERRIRTYASSGMTLNVGVSLDQTGCGSLTGVRRGIVPGPVQSLRNTPRSSLRIIPRSNNNNNNNDGREALKGDEDMSGNMRSGSNSNNSSSKNNGGSSSSNSSSKNNGSNSSNSSSKNNGGSNSNTNNYSSSKKDSEDNDYSKDNNHIKNSGLKCQVNNDTITVKCNNDAITPEQQLPPLTTAQESNAACDTAIIIGMTEYYEELAEVLLKRCEARLLLVEKEGQGKIDEEEEKEEEEEASNGLPNALKDALRASELVPGDLEYRLLVASCHLRMEKFHSAIDVLLSVLAVSSKNENALFQYAYCLKALKKDKEAIKCLTLLIAVASRSKEEDHLRSTENSISQFSVPLGRVFETRGTILLETQEYELAFEDFSEAIQLSPERADSYFFRGNCQCKLHNYREAIKDFIRAEEREYSDNYTLLTNRGISYRLLDMPAEALEDFFNASKLLIDINKVENIRIEMFKALCVVGVKDYITAQKMIMSTLNLLKEYRKVQKLAFTSTSSRRRLPTGVLLDQIPMKNITTGLDMNTNTPMSPPLPPPLISTSSSSSSSLSMYSADLSSNSSESFLSLSVGPFSPSISGDKKARATLTAVDLQSLCKFEWILCYHSALCLYHTGRYSSALKMINRCTAESSNKSPQIDSPLTEKIPGEHSSSKSSPQDVIDNLRQYAPDDETLGICYYFKGISLSYLHCLDDSFISFENALHSSFCKILTEDDKIQNKINYPNNYHEIEYNKLHNRMLCYFSIAKIFQRKSNHLLAVEYFTRSLHELPNHEGRAFIYFRRAWSYKALSNFDLAGDDFETAKLLKVGDPNFSLEYKSLANCEYMEFTTEPDLIEPFPPLLLLNSYI